MGQIIWKETEIGLRAFLRDDHNIDKPITWTPQPGSQEAAMTCPIGEVLYSGTRGPGKALYNQTLILTKAGWKQVGEVTYEDQLVSPDGSFCNILGIFPQPVNTLYAIEFFDGHTIHADLEHRWKVYSQKTGKRDGWKVKTTQELLKAKTQWSIPYLEGPIQGEPWSGPDPYMLGYLIANGTTGSDYVTIYSIDEEVLNYAWDKHGWRVYSYAGQTAKRAVCPRSDKPDNVWRVVLGHKTAHDKVIPPELLKSDHVTRLALLQGLMDGDGNCESGAKSRYTTVSEQLAKDVTYLVKSLGGWAVYQKKDSDHLIKGYQGCGYKYVVNISHHNQFNPFRLSRKAEQWKQQTKFLTRGIKSISPSIQGESTCFSVDHPSKCFVIEDFVITHNTDWLLMDFAQHVGQGYGAEWQGIIFRRTFPELDDIINKSMKWYKQIWKEGDIDYNKQSHTWVWKTGESLKFRHFQKEADYWSYHGHAYPFIGWEELTTWPTSACYLKMMSCNRSTVKGIPLKIRATTNPYGCVPYGEVLTATRGWVPIQEVQVGEQVLSCTPTGELIEASVSRIIEQDYSGNMRIRNGAGLHMIFTEDHRFPHLNTARTHHDMRPFNELPGQAVIRRTGHSWAGKPVESFTVPYIESSRKLRKEQPYTVNIEDFAELLGWYVSEGSVDPGGKWFSISQMKVGNRNTIKLLLDRMGFFYSVSANQFMVYSISWGTYFLSLGKSCREKSLPQWVLQCSQHVIQRLFDAAMLGDGCAQNYYTTSKTLSYQMQEIGVKLGKAVFTHTRQRENRFGPCYEIRFSDRGTVQFNTGNHGYNVGTVCKLTNISKESFTGKVYCLTVPETETFFIRQNGCVWLSGNSGHNWVKARWRLPIVGNKIIGPVIRDSRTIDGDLEPPRVAIHGYLQENKILLSADPTYIAKLKSAASNPAELKAWLDGDWNIVAGGMLDDLWTPGVHVVPTFPYNLIPRGWRIDRSFDYGSARPFSIGIWAESNGEPFEYNGRIYGAVPGDIYRIAEWYGWNGRENEGVKMQAGDIAEGLLDRIEDWGLTGRVRPGPADDSIFDDYEPKHSVAGDMQAKGVRWEKAGKGSGSRKQGWLQIRKYLKGALPNVEGPREDPGLFVCDCCTQFLRTVPVLPRSDIDLDDVDTEVEDHIGDEVRYRLRRKKRETKQGKF